jgi:DNA-binding SARP family transcriptional activator
MRRRTGGWGVPDFGVGLRRPRLLRMMEDAGTRPKVLVAPPGSGKSVLASQYALACERMSIWISGDGSAISHVELSDKVGSVLANHLGVSGNESLSCTSGADSAALIADLMRSVGPPNEARLLVDDVGPQSRESADFLRRLGSVLWRQGTELIITTRSTATWPAAQVCDFAVVDQQHLALTEAEANELALQLEVSLTSSELIEIHQLSAGNIGLFSAMAVQVARHGRGVALRSTSLDAWLGRAIDDLEASDQDGLAVISSMKSGSVPDLVHLGLDDAERVLLRISHAIPLVRISTNRGESTFTVHDLVDAFGDEIGLAIPEAMRGPMLSVLAENGDYVRSCELLARFGDEESTREWLLAHGRDALSCGCISALDRLFGRTSVGVLMGEAANLVLWSQVCYETGRYEESLAKAKAARLLAEHERDDNSIRGAISQTLLCSRYLRKQEEADALAQEVADSNEPYVDNMLLAEALFCIGYGRVARGELATAREPFETVISLCEGAEPEPQVARLARNSLSLLPAILVGDFQASRALLSEIADDPDDLPSTRIMVRGNLAQCLVEIGRIERAANLATTTTTEAKEFGLDNYAGAYVPVLGMSRFLGGDDEGGIRQISQGIEQSRAAGDAQQAAVDALYLSQALRAYGEVEESLTAAEQAFEILSICDTMGSRPFAALEVGASLLSSGDCEAADAWIALADGLELPMNLSRRTRSALLRAEIDRRKGRLQEAVERLRELGANVRSENHNLAGALYSRAFPHLLGMLAAAITPSALPSHMLRMIPPESAEQILVETHAWLEDGTWRELGIRLLGEEEFAKFLARDGLPVCHVRFFGGLEVSIGGRSVREKDWRKRKARLLFAMLVLRRGQDVPREQLFEYLFSEMSPQRAKNNLYVVWSTMKSVLMGDGSKGSPLPYLEAVGGVCRSVRENIRADVDDFDKLLAAAARHEQAGELADAVQAYEQLSSLYRGELLPGDVYDDWFAELREHYKLTFVNAMLAASAILMNADDPGNALVYARRAIQTDPLREDLYQVALRCQIAAGQRSGAIDTYLQCRAKLAEDLGLDPSTETKALYTQILAMEDRPRITPLDPLVD